MLKILDLYILKKYLISFFFILGIIMLIATVFDVSEKIDDFINNNAPIYEILVNYYINFIFFYGNMFSPLIIFISVIFFTSNLASKSEFISILSSGISFNRLLYPYLIGSTMLMLISLIFNHFVVPMASAKRLQFEWKYINNPLVNNEKYIHKQVLPNEFIFVDNYTLKYDIGYLFSYEKFQNNELVYKLMARYIQWDTIKKKWSVHHYKVRHLSPEGETLNFGIKFDTIWNFYPKDFRIRSTRTQTMTTPELSKYIKEESMKGSELIPVYYIDKYQRSSFPIAIYILTLIGVSIAGRKVRGGIGLHIALGLLLCGIYILSMQISSVFARNIGINPLLSAWIPNILFSIIALYFYFKAQK